MAVNPASIAAGVAIAQQLVKGSKALYNEVKPRKSRRAPPPRARQARNPARPQGSRMAGVAVARANSTSVPKSTYRRVETRVENIGSFASTGTAFNYRVVPVQPGSSASFPWLSGISREYGYHHFLKLRFRIVPSTATSSAGRVTLAPLYAPNSSIDDVVDLNNAVGAKSSAIWDEVAIDLDPRAMYPFGYYKTVTTGMSDSGNADAARVYIGFDGVASGVSVSVYAEYTVELFMPRSAILENNVNTHSILQATALAISTTDTKITPIDWAHLNPFDIVVDTPNSTMLLPKGVWEVELSYQVSFGSGTPTALYWINCALGDTSARFSASQIDGQKYTFQESFYHITGNASIHSSFMKLMYVSDGVTPMAIWRDCSANSADTTNNVQIWLSPIA